MVGDHSVIFAGPDERISFRTTPKTGRSSPAVRCKAALWAHGKKPGFYTMADVLGLGDFEVQRRRNGQQ